MGGVAKSGGGQLWREVPAIVKAGGCTQRVIQRDGAVQPEAAGDSIILVLRSRGVGRPQGVSPMLFPSPTQ